MSESDSRAVHVRLDISVPVGAGEIHVQGQRRRAEETHAPPIIEHPDHGGTTLIKQVNGRWYMCAKGLSNHRHIFARVYNPAGAPSMEPEEGPDTGWDKPEAGEWQIDLLPVPDGPGAKKIAVWGDDGTAYERTIHSFTAQSSVYTYCETYSGMATAAKAKKPVAMDWSTLPDRWQFQIAGVSNASSNNCACLNGTWLLRREGKALLWLCQLNTSFSDAKQRCWWRLAFNEKDGFWYLECVGDQRQPPGTSIAYRRHESAWKPGCANDLLLLTNHGYCNVPDYVTLYPA